MPGLSTSGDVLPGQDVCQCIQDMINFRTGVVVNGADSNRATAIINTQRPRCFNSVNVPAPDKNISCSQLRCNVVRMLAFDGKLHGNKKPVH